MTSRPLIIYHKNCDDGFGAAYAAWKRFGDAADYLAMDYADVPAQAPVDGREVIAADFSFTPADTFAHILPRVASLTILDHHLSAMDDWQAHLGRKNDNGILSHTDGNLHVFFDMSKSGAYLAWEHFHPDAPVPRMIAHISDGDLWAFKLDGTRRFYSYLRSQERSFASFDALCTAMANDGGAQAVIETGGQINAFYRQQLAGIVASKRYVPIEMTAVGDGKPVTARGLAVNASKLFSSELGNMLAAQSGTFAVVWETDGTTAYCSMRSVDGFDSIPFAIAQGGGGHAQACGFIVPLDKLLAALRGEKTL